MNIRLVAPALLLLLLTSGPEVHAQPLVPSKDAMVAPYLLPDAPTFDQTIPQFRTRYNLSNPSLPIVEFRAVDTGEPAGPLTRAASRINAQLYASTALERGTGKIKTMQLTYHPQVGDPETGARRAQSIQYMAALLRHFIPSLSEEQSSKKITELLDIGKRQGFYQQTEGALRYVVADNGENGITFAVEPIKLTLSEP
ncbi:DUF1454 family protein [Symbiopectobacterium purcellii]|uniref:DUF1454 family protein n=1 Tax=Symbiopectobacterium purcellii TaxID=2871826 RepID=UPI003F844E62